MRGLAGKHRQLFLGNIRCGRGGHKERPGKEDQRRERQILVAYQIRRGRRAHCRFATPVECKRKFTRRQQNDRIQHDDQNRNSPEPEARARNRFQHQAAVRPPNSRLNHPPMMAAAPAKIRMPNLPITLNRPVSAAAAAAPPTMSPVRPYSAILSPWRYSE